MKAHITVITLGVSDLEKALTFYRDGLGLQIEGIVGGCGSSSSVVLLAPTSTCRF